MDQSTIGLDFESGETSVVETSVIDLSSVKQIRKYKVIKYCKYCQLFFTEPSHDSQITHK